MNKIKVMKKLGIDVGGVIIKNATEGNDTSFFSDNFLKTPPNEEAFNTITKLNDMFDDVYIVSKCGYKIRNKTLDWFKYHNFYDITGISPDNVYFCHERWEKHPICEKLGITHFIDDKLEVLSYLESVKFKYLFKPKSRELKKFNNYLLNVTIVDSWNELIKKIK